MQPPIARGVPRLERAEPAATAEGTELALGKSSRAARYSVLRRQGAGAGVDPPPAWRAALEAELGHSPSSNSASSGLQKPACPGSVKSAG